MFVHINICIIETLVDVTLKKIYITFISKYWHHNLCYCYFEEDKYLFLFIALLQKFSQDYVNIVEITSTQHYTRIA